MNAHFSMVGLKERVKYMWRHMKDATVPIKPT